MEKLTHPHVDGGTLNWIVPVSRCAFWEPEASADSPKMPDVPFIEPSLRRRLSLFARMSLKVAHDCAGDMSGIRIVFASRHGDLTRTTSMLLDLADKELLSPTTFSMSVLNACIGIYSIAKKELSPSTALAAGDSSLGYGLLEACMQLTAEPTTPVLFIYADEPAPGIYGIENEDIQTPLALAILLESNANAWILCETEPAQSTIKFPSQPHAFLECLRNKKDARWHGAHQLWKWSWHERAN
ncbi:MAG: 3-oxoacyl-ACP synthase [Oxalobacter sp.]|jgi:hypothetical protein|nr:MAG: 3-oxoacyl-ACP synthase [Oxalobacter sp.]